MVEIKNRYTGMVLKSVEADSLYGANLERADLKRADLGGAEKCVTEV